MKNARQKRSMVAAAVFIACVLLFRAYTADDRSTLYYVKRVVDGDTIVLANGERVRYTGINTPETKHPYKAVEYFGREAYLYNKQLVEKKWVKLEFDAEKRDRYNRLLAYVYIKDIFVNAKLVEEGYAQVYTVPPNVKYEELFLKLQRQARKNRKGLWAK